MILTVYSQSGGEESNELICINFFLNYFSLCLRGGATELKGGVDEK